MVDTLLVFMLAGQRLALPGHAVQECLPLPRLERRPGQPDAVAGFFRLGPETLPVIDLACLLGLRAAQPASMAEPRLEADGLYRHLLRMGGLALLVDRALSFGAAAAAPAEAAADEWQHGCILRRLLVDGESVALLDPHRLLLAHEQERLLALTEAARRREAGWEQQQQNVIIAEE